jgi:plasmid maintenance system antidote protein VapI
MQAAYHEIMEKVESLRRARRREKLNELVMEAGSATKLAIETGTPKSHISALCSGKRGVGDDLAQKLEGIYGKSAGWFDAASTNQLVTVPQIGGRKLASLGETLESLSEHLKSMDLDTRRSAMLLITDLERAPDTHQKVTAMIELSIRLSVPKRA